MVRCERTTTLPFGLILASNTCNVNKKQTNKCFVGVGKSERKITKEGEKREKKKAVTRVKFILSKERAQKKRERTSLYYAFPCKP